MAGSSKRALTESNPLPESDVAAAPAADVCGVCDEDLGPSGRVTCRNRACPAVCVPCFAKADAVFFKCVFCQHRFLSKQSAVDVHDGVFASDHETYGIYEPARAALVRREGGSSWTTAMPAAAEPALRGRAPRRLLGPATRSLDSPGVNSRVYELNEDVGDDEGLDPDEYDAGLDPDEYDLTDSFIHDGDPYE